MDFLLLHITPALKFTCKKYHGSVCHIFHVITS